MQVLSELKTRGVRDILICCVGGLSQIALKAGLLTRSLLISLVATGFLTS
jgi:hypothetical protein